MANLYYLLLASGTILAQTTTFEAASIRVNRNGSNSIGGTGVCFSGGKVSVRNMPFSMIMQRAFDVKDFQIVGAPGSLGAERFDIEAKPASPVKYAECLQMLQALLTERFQLQFHPETRQLPVFNLVAIKSGPKMKKLPDSGPTGVQSFNNGIFDTDTFGISMERLASILSTFQEIGKPVIDQTGLNGIYQVRLEWMPEHGNAEQTGISLFAALQEQLGLKLKPGKGRVYVIVIDHINKTATEN